ncbi:MAG: M20/M25/M40 family metallo-hydrolase [Dehalococcoidia bacterium]|nr:M20/M25/M40 family metallo-hydrolase [Dehalococcoidia bacterium]
MQDIFRHIDDHNDDAIQSLIDLCRLPTVSAQKRAIAETAEHVAALLRALGFETQVLPKPVLSEAEGREGAQTGGRPSGHPVVYAEARGASPRTLLFYDHYDVQPAEPLDLWSSPPFEPALRDGKLYGRGVSDNKGNIAARLAAIRAWREVRGELPCAIKFCIEGDEEIGSPQMEEFVAEHRELLAADACIWEGGGVTWEGLPQVVLGVKGLLYVQLEVGTVNRDAHSSYGTVLPNAAWRLAWALSTIKGPDERILIDGFFDAVRPPTPEERAAIEAMPREDAETLASFGIKEALLGVRGVDYIARHLFEPTATIDGLSSGYEGEGPKTVLPARAMAKMDFRLVPDQDPHDVLAKLRAHLDRHGFADVRVTDLGGEHPARTPVTDPFVRVMRDAIREAYGAEAVIVPAMAGTGPLYPFIQTLGLPTADCGIGYPDAHIHAPDENIRIEDFRRGTKAIAALLGRFGAS